MTSLFNLVTEYRETCDKLADLDLDAQTIADTLEGEQWSVQVKAQNVALVALSLESMAAAIKEREQALKQRREAIEKRREHLMQYLSDNLARAGIEKVEEPDVRLTWRKSEAVEVEDASMIPAEYMAAPPPPDPKPDKAAIKAAIKAGKDVPGARIEVRRNLQIK